VSLRLVILFIILVSNGFFAAAEVSLVSVRQSRLVELAESGNAGAQSALSLLANPGRLLSVTQFGVTLASLGLGWAGEDTMYTLLLAGLERVNLSVAPAILHGIGFALSFLIISYAHVIIGEVVPKNLAIQKADRMAILSAPVLLVFYRLSQPFVVVIERSADAILRAFGLNSSHGHGGHTPEELKYIVETLGREGHLHSFEQASIDRLIGISEVSAREIMTPRPDIVSLPVDATLEDVLSTLAEHKFARVPIYEDRPEKIIGFVHYKDLMRVWVERRNAHDRRRNERTFRLRRFVRKALVFPETKPLTELVDEFRKNHTRMALVVDEFGTITGLITLDDVMEQVFGSIQDEHDDLEVTETPEASTTTLQLEGSTTIRELETRYNLELPADAGFETLAGFLLYQIGRIPHVGDAVVFGERRMTVTQMDRNRIALVLIEKVDAPEAASTPVDPDKG
jgi:putative hemolysin